MKYKVGDKVRVKEDLEPMKNYGGQTFVDEMIGYMGKVFTIKTILPMGEYLLLETKEGWYWTDEMLERITSAPFTKQDLQTGDVIQLRNGKHIIFINQNIGFVDLEKDVMVFTGRPDYGNIKYCAFKDDLTHFMSKKEYDIVKVYRANDKLPEQHILTNVKEGTLDVVWKEKSKQYYTLEEASKFGKNIKHKDSTTYVSNPLFALNEAIGKTGKSMFEVLQLKEFEVEE